MTFDCGYKLGYETVYDECTAWAATLKMEAIYSSKIFVNAPEITLS